MERIKNASITKFSIPQYKIDELNNLLSDNKLDIFFKKLNQLLLNGKKIYQKYGTSPEKKEKIIVFIIREVTNLSRKLNIKRVYNSSAGIKIREYKYKNLEQLNDFFRIRGEKKIQKVKKGATCNIFVYYFYGLLKQITENDPEIKFSFELNRKTNHGKLIISINKSFYVLESIEKGLVFEKYKKTRNTDIIIYSDIEQYLESSIAGQLKLDRITYQYGKYLLKLYNFYGVKFFSFNTKPIRKLNIHGFKRLSKYIQYIIKLRPLFKVENTKQLKEKIIKGNKEKEILTKILDQLDETFLENFINKKAKTI